MKNSELLEALQIVAKYQEDGYHLCAEHDCIWIAHDLKGITEEDVKRLDELGIWPNHEGGGWGGFV
jgi:hypothetical protein